MIAPGLLLLAAAADVRITHPPLVCLVANKSPRIEAVIAPTEDVRARVYFKSGSGEFYSVPMVPRLGRFAGTLPRPKEKAGTVVYYIEAALPDGRVNRTSEITTRIVRDARSCSSVAGVPDTVDAGDVEIFSAGTTHKPEGFDGVSRVTPFAGAARGAVSSSPAPAPARATAPAPAAAPSVETAAAPPAAPSPSPSVAEYQIGPEDILKVTVYGHDDLTQTVVVQSDGTFVFPLIGRVKGGDLSPKELERKITVLLSQGFIRNPQVMVLVQEYRSKTIFVVGEISRPGTYPLAGARTLVEALARAGPTTANAGGEVVIVRPHGEVQGPVLPSQVGEGPTAAGAEVIRVNLPDIQAGDLSKNVLLRPNDTVFVPLAPKVFVSGEVRNPGAYPFSPGTTVRQAISLAGGLTEDGSAGRIRVVRAVEGKSREIKIKIDDPIQPGDTIVVKSKLF